MSEQNCSYMDTQIFQQGLSVLATSAYIMVAALMSDGIKPEYESLSCRWPATENELNQALTELMELNIVQVHTDAKGQRIFLVNPASMWG